MAEKELFHLSLVKITAHAQWIWSKLIMSSGPLWKGVSAALPEVFKESPNSSCVGRKGDFSAEKKSTLSESTLSIRIRPSTSKPRIQQMGFWKLGKPYILSFEEGQHGFPKRVRETGLPSSLAVFHQLKESHPKGRRLSPEKLGD